MNRNPIRVLVADDSAFMRSVITRILQGDPGIRVIDVARNGLEAVAKAIALRPDVVTLDVEMPKLDGLGALRRIMAECPCPVVMVSSQTRAGAATTVQALALGAVDFVAKPSGPVSLDLDRVAHQLRQKVRLAAQVPVHTLRLPPGRREPVRRPRTRPPGPVASRPSPPPHPPAHLPGGLQAAGEAPPRAQTQTAPMSHLVLIAASTGGPGVLYRLLERLPSHLAAAVVIVQHMPPGFTEALARHLDAVSALSVAEAADGDLLHDGRVLVAPGDYHLWLKPDGRVRLDRSPPRHNVRPAADVTFTSVPPPWAPRTIALVLSGMGKDGAMGASYLKHHGARIWIQDERTCVVAGMPRTVAELGLADRVGSPEELASWLVAATAPPTAAGPGDPADAGLEPAELPEPTPSTGPGRAQPAPARRVHGWLQEADFTPPGGETEGTGGGL